MKHNMNIIEIRGLRGIILAAATVCCLAVGFIGFPGWILMHSWNYAASYFTMVPTIGILQGILLWGIVIASYFTFKKDRLVVCVKTPKGLSEDELKDVFENIKAQSAQDKILQAMLKAREAELKYKEAENQVSEKEETTVNKD